MADGCNLYFTEKDLNQVEKSLNSGGEFNETKMAANILNGRIINSVEDFKKILGDHNDPRHKVVQDLLEKALSNGKLIGRDIDKLSSALLTVLEQQSNLQGLFQNPPKYIGPGGQSMKHGGELLTTAAIIKASRQSDGITTSLGNKLYIDKHYDTIGFGQKLPAKYALPTRKKGTIEADTLISRITYYDPILGMHDFKRIGIDTKYIKDPKWLNPTYGVMPGLERQLNGIRHAFRDGSIEEFYFVSNVAFSEQFKGYIKDYNVKIFMDHMRRDYDLQDKAKEYLSKAEKETYIPKGIEEKDLQDNYKMVEKLAKEYKIPQIGYCQNVNYE